VWFVLHFNCLCRIEQGKEYWDLAKVCGLYYIFIVSVALNSEKNIGIWQRCVVYYTHSLNIFKLPVQAYCSVVIHFYDSQLAISNLP
jgi:hypothetical protein